MATPAIHVGDQVYLVEGGEEFGAIRTTARDHLVVYVENGGDFVVPIEAVRRAHDHKVLLDPTKLEPKLRDAIMHAHDREDPRL